MHTQSPKHPYLAVWEIDGLLDAPNVFFVGFTLPGVHGHAGLGNGSGSMILRAEDVARRPLNLCAKFGLRVGNF